MGEVEEIQERKIERQREKTDGKAQQFFFMIVISLLLDIQKEAKMKKTINNMRRFF